MGKSMKLSSMGSRLVVAGLLAFVFTLSACGEASDDLALEQSSEVEEEPTEWVEPPLDTSDLGMDWDRPATVYVPANYTAAEDWPLVFLLHGFTATGAIQNSYLGFSRKVDSRGFILVVPDGTSNPQGAQFWNGTDYCCDFYGQNPDDAGYLLSLIDEAKSRFNVNAGKVYMTGHSNGGFMSHRLACDHADVITGIMSLAGATFKDPERCQNSEPVAMLQVHGTEDETIRYNGDSRYPSAEETTAQWRANNACGSVKEMGAIAIEGAISETETDVLSGNSCNNNMTAELWTIKGGSHIPAFNGEFVDLVLDFLFRHEKIK
jgi:polyhydroxybutyrate depolymerase